jgi:hypothetical protein
LSTSHWMTLGGWSLVLARKLRAKGFPTDRNALGCLARSGLPAQL